MVDVGGEDVKVDEVDGTEAEDSATCVEVVTAEFWEEQPAVARTAARIVTDRATTNDGLPKKQPLFIASPSRRDPVGSYDAEIRP